MLARLAATLPLIVAGCGDNAPTGPVAGTRLALTGVSFSDGDLVETDPTTFYDRSRNETCTLEVWSDGATHCTPAATELVYRDADCSTAALVGELRYVRIPFAPGDPRISRLRAAGDRAGTGTYFQREDAGCISHSTAESIYAVSDSELTADAFARVRKLADATTERLAAVRAESDDGLRIQVAYHDTLLDLDCAPRSVPGGLVTECAPTRTVPPSYFADATCTTVTASRASAATADAIEATIDGCPVDLAFGPGADVLFDGTPAHCIQNTTLSASDFLIAGDPLALVPLARTIEPASSRFALITNDTLVHDNQLGIDCAPSGGRCVPPTEGTYLAPLFRDDACTEAITEAYVPTRTCGAELAYATDGTQLFPIGAIDPGPLYTISTSEICAPMLPVAGFTPHLLGTAVPLETFGTATRVVL